jgi:hypothetical protein
VKILVHHGAWVNYKNNYQFSAITIAGLAGNSHIAAYLRNYYELNLPSWNDGPYVQWTSKHRIRVTGYRRDSVLHRTTRFVRHYHIDSLPFAFRAPEYDSVPYLLHRQYPVQNAFYTGVKKLMILGDVHGDYIQFFSFLLANHIIDSSGNWSWKDGHLVILGDLFDRGDRVTECLWLVNKLQFQAAGAGGAVHLLLGNHEIMELKGDHRYLNEKYSYLSEFKHRNYSDNFKPSTELGRWLRSLNTMEVIDSFLFVHAGLHPYLAESGVKIDQVNQLVREVMNHRNDRQLPPLYHWLVSESGPLWYRGYFRNFRSEEPLEQEQLSRILAYFGAGTMFIGHTNVPDLTPLYNGRVIAMDIPYYLGKGQPKGLFICDGGLCIALSDGTIVPFHEKKDEK